MHYVVHCHLMVTDFNTKKEIHCEDVAVAFTNGESKWLRGTDVTYYFEHANILYWLKRNALVILEGKQFQQFKDHCIKIKNDVYKKFDIEGLSIGVDAMVLETKEFKDLKELGDYIYSLNSGNKTTIFQNEFM